MVVTWWIVAFCQVFVILFTPLTYPHTYCTPCLLITKAICYVIRKVLTQSLSSILLTRRLCVCSVKCQSLCVYCKALWVITLKQPGVGGDNREICNVYCAYTAHEATHNPLPYNIDGIICGRGGEGGETGLYCYSGQLFIWEFWKTVAHKSLKHWLSEKLQYWSNTYMFLGRSACFT